MPHEHWQDVYRRCVFDRAFVAMAWFGWFGPVTKSFQAIKKKHGPASRQALISQYLARQRTKCNDDGQELLYPDIETHHASSTGRRKRG